MKKPLDFYFDFSSPYAYLASTRIEALGQELGRDVVWRPILLGPMFQAMGSGPLVDIPLKGAYAERDFARSAQLFDIPYQRPDPFPIATVGAARATLFLRAQGGNLAAAFAHRVFDAYYVQGQDIRDAAILRAQAQAIGFDPAALEQGMADPAIKAALKQDVADAMGRGVFGSPFVFVDDEPFWGFDRFDHIRRWAARQAG
ncbi:2-hydroxychromene-2-carboxylate isomerase [Castellaniella sp.]|uniref:2-hydroxychromene-2-carboxylate isomerase n=1 Tax=Castellaniella sp. TaxID=1955812 RepID=UPI00355F6983